MDDNRVSNVMGLSVDKKLQTEEYHIKRGMTGGLAREFEEFFLEGEFPGNLNSYELCQKWVLKCYWDPDMLDAEMQAIIDDKREYESGQKERPCYESDEWCYEFFRRLTQQYITLPARKIDTYADLSLRSPNTKQNDIEMFSDWEDIAEGY